MLEHLFQRYEKIKNARYVLGLDLGVASIGWAIVDTSQQRIVKLGVVKFREGSASDNQDRRQKRGARRNRTRFLNRREKLRNLCQKYLTNGEPVLTTGSKNIWELRVKGLFEKLDNQEFAHILLHFNRHRGFKSNRKTDKGADTSAMKKTIAETRQKLEEKKQTLSQYYLDLIKDGQKIRANFTENDLCPDRAMYQEELDKIWEKQKEFEPYNQILTDELYQKIIEETIFYQRDFHQKKDKRNVGKCPFFPQNLRAPIYSMEYQEFRVRQIINNLRLTDDRNGVVDEFLPEKVKNYIYDRMTFQTKSKIKASEIISLIRKNKDCYRGSLLNYDKKEAFYGNRIGYELTQIFGETQAKKLIVEYDQKGENSALHKLIHTLRSCPFSENDKAEEWLRNYALNLKNEEGKSWITPEEAEKFALLNPDSGYGNLSTKALRLILPYLRQGFIYSEACEKAGLNHTDPNDEKDRKLIEKLEPIPAQERLNATVKKALNQMISLVNTIKKDKELPEIDAVVLETVRELKMPEEKRNGLKRRNDAKARRREEYAQILRQEGVRESGRNIRKYELWLELGLQDSEALNAIDIKNFSDFTRKVSAKAHEKYQLWKEANRRCPYTGEIIRLSDLFNTQLVDIEHIYPRSKTLDDSFMNKTIALRTANAQKENRLPLEYLKATGGNIEAFRTRVQHFQKGKRERFLATEIPEGFIARNYTDTAQITKVALDKLQEIFPDVIATNGSVTAVLRNAWKLQKSRDTLVHHAMDAVVISWTSRNIIQALSTISGQGGNIYNPQNERKQGWRKLPFSGFTEYVERELDKITVYHYNRKRLVQDKLDLKDKNPKKKPVVRGALHKETLYGKATVIHTDKKGKTKEVEVSTKRIKVKDDKGKPLPKSTLAKILSSDVRESVHQWLESPDSEYPKHPKTGHPIRKVRIDARLNPDKLLEICSHNLEKGQNAHFVANDQIYIAGIYQNAKGKRKLAYFSLYESLQNHKNKYPLLPETHPENPSFHLWLPVKAGDMFRFEEQEINGIYRVLSFSENSIVFAHHTKPIAEKDFKRSVDKFEYVTPVKVDILGNVTPKIT